MADKQKTLEDAYDLFSDWTAANKARFADLLTDDVVWIEGDTDLDPGTYVNKQEVMLHVEHVKSHLDSATRTSVSVQGQRGTTTDNMQVHGHPNHECVTDVIFRDDLIAQVHHCLRHTP
jgi:ketosteroid isomerase-like protein